MSNFARLEAYAWGTLRQKLEGDKKFQQAYRDAVVENVRAKFMDLQARVARAKEAFDAEYARVQKRNTVAQKFGPVYEEVFPKDSSPLYFAREAEFLGLVQQQVAAMVRFGVRFAPLGDDGVTPADVYLAQYGLSSGFAVPTARALAVLPAIQDLADDVLAAMDEFDAKILGRDEEKDLLAQKITTFTESFATGRRFHNIMITGPPGTGKTEFAKMVSKLYAASGFLLTKTFANVTAADLIAEYEGQTQNRTRAVLWAGYEGTTFVDEAYALAERGAGEGPSFGRDAINVIVPFMSETEGSSCLIAAGYRREMHELFLKANIGLESRFGLIMDFANYTPPELFRIFRKKFRAETGAAPDSALNGLAPFDRGAVAVFLEYAYVYYSEFFASQARDAGALASFFATAVLKSGVDVVDATLMGDLLLRYAFRKLGLDLSAEDDEVVVAERAPAEAEGYAERRAQFRADKRDVFLAELEVGPVEEKDEAPRRSGRPTKKRRASARLVAAVLRAKGGDTERAARWLAKKK